MSTTTNSPAHEANGRFAFGNPGGPGNPNVRRASMMKRAIAQAVTVEEITAVFKAMVARAIDGDREAGRLVLFYTVGKPDAFHAAMEKMDDFDETMVSPPPTPPVAAPGTTSMPSGPVPRDNSHLLRRGEREPTMEELLGIAPKPSSNGANGPISVTTKSPASSATESVIGRTIAGRTAQK